MLTLFDSASKTKRIFTPINPNNVRMYVCGPTVYDLVHIGNARPVIVFDILYRLLKYYFPKVIYARNITDIDDKIISRAHETGITIEQLTEQTTKAYQDDMDALGAQRPDHEPKATEYVAGMISMIQGLIEKGHAYASNGHVLFRIESYPGYGNLSKFPQEELEAGARVEVAPYKESPTDFVLWKPSSSDQPGWESPWGRGRPGWHIECSVMSSALLGPTFDIHGGGIDLIFPHHENECAQSCAFHGTEKLANYWMHNGHLLVNGSKMSKSLGNFITVRELLKKHPGEIIRYAFLSTHYRQPLDFSDDMMVQAKNNLIKIYHLLRKEQNLMPSEHPDPEFLEALNDDLNTPQALTILHKRLNELNKGKGNLGEFLKSLEIIGILPKDFKGTDNRLPENEIQELINKRNIARNAKDYKESDRIRDLLESEGVILEDAKGETNWHYKLWSDVEP